MNRIILIGNGFDLAHNLKTGYRHFLDDFWETKKLDVLAQIEKNLRDGCRSPFSKIDPCEKPYGTIRLSNPPSNGGLFMYCLRMSPAIGFDWVEKTQNCYNRRDDNNFDTITLKHDNRFLRVTSENAKLKYWSGIEKDYYDALITCLDDDASCTKIEKLNDEFLFVTEALVTYLKKTTGNGVATNVTIGDKIYSNATLDDFPGKQPTNAILEKILFLSFNYTKTDELYIRSGYDCESMRIHGDFDNPQNIIFGYGDERGVDFERIKEKDGPYLKNIKMSSYSNTDCYNKLQRFIGSNEYQVFVMGHSCSITDRYILGKLFENSNCLSIKPFYYQMNATTDDYKDLKNRIQNLFTDGNMIYEKLVTKQHCETLL